jgi:outer membrane PBP1 activator LpoA protein
MGRLAKILLLGSLLCGLCPSGSANTTAIEAVRPAGAQPALQLVMRPRIALLLPLRAEALKQAAEAVRAGFMVAYQREPRDVTVDVLATDETRAGVLDVYREAAAKYDIVVGPLSRTGVTSVAQEGAISKPTLALNAPETPEGSEPKLPPGMLAMGLSLDDEARQVVDWASVEEGAAKAFVIHTDTPWQRRAAAAFANRWRGLGLDAEPMEIALDDGYLDWRKLTLLKRRVQDTKDPLLFVALDAWQTKQLREVVGRAAPLYGTSQLNPYALLDWQTADRIPALDGARLIDLPWQLDPDHPAVMIYPRPVVEAGKPRSADLERLYALGIDAYRVAHEIAQGNTDFELDGVTGRLVVHFDGNSASFARTAERAVYRDGTVVPLQ